MSGAEHSDDAKWTLGIRAIPNQISRAQLRMTLTYRLHPRLMLGIELNPLAGKVGPLANLVVLSETRVRPAIIVGTSSDRIGTPSGQSVYATASKNIEPWTTLPLEPYVGVAYGSYRDDVRPIGGMNVRLSDRWTATGLYDGRRGHALLSYSLGRHQIGLVLERGWNPGMSYSVAF